jgi:hypothetical protein
VDEYLLYDENYRFTNIIGEKECINVDEIWNDITPTKKKN